MLKKHVKKNKTSPFPSPPAQPRASCFLYCFPQNEYMKDDFLIKIETWHKPDLGKQENVSPPKKVEKLPVFYL